MYKHSSGSGTPQENKNTLQPTVLSASVHLHAEHTYNHAESVKHNKSHSEETAYALRKIVSAVCASATQCGESSDVAQYALQRVSKTLDTLDDILADNKKGFLRRWTLKRRLLALQVLISRLKMELEITLDGRCNLIERDEHAAAFEGTTLTHPN